ncbi:MAG TPA: ATP-binding cassette domain-containing protein [Mycobacteriales bacterium]|nr:ATP-binding cassette domain-containing protein [Mycobacteriales bacterium]
MSTPMSERLGAVRLRPSSKRTVLKAVLFAAAVVVAKLVLIVLSRHGVIDTGATPMQVVVLGATTGMTYGLLGVGLVLIYRSNRIINFAHGNIGAFGAAFFAVAAVKWHIPYWVAFLMAIALAALVGVGAEAAAVRRLRNAPPLMSVVVTLGIGQFLVFFSLVINSTAGAGTSYPSPPFMPTFHVQSLLVTRAYSGMLILSPMVVIGLAVFLRVSKFGLGIRAAAANPEAARMAGIFAGRMSSLSWAIAGAISAFTAILVAPASGFVSSSQFGPDLVLRAMTAAAVGRMENLPATFFAGIGLGIVENVLLWDTQNSGVVQMALFVVVLVVLLLQRRRAGRGEDKGSWATVQSLRPLPEPLQRLTSVRLLGPAVTMLFFGALAVVPLVMSNSHSVTFVLFISAAIVGLSITVLTGLGGQLTLGQFMVAAIGAVVSYQVSRRIGDFPLALLYAGLAAGVVSVVIGLPALRLRSLMLTITTLAFAIAGPAWLLSRPYMFGDGVEPGAPVVAGRALDTGHEYYYFALALFFICFIICANVRRSGFGRLLVAIRDNENNARAFTVRATVVKVQGYLISGFVAGIGGAAYAHSLSSIDGSVFSTDLSINVVVMTVLGGISSLAGPIIGSGLIIGIPLVPKIGNLGLAATFFGATCLILWRPSGLVTFVETPRRLVICWLAKLHGVDGKAAFAGDRSVAAGSEGPRALTKPRLGGEQVPPQRHGSRATLLDATHLSKRFGGVTAVDDVSFAVRAGETVGLIGPNGAGKTTTFEILGGFTKPDAGAVRFDRRDVSRLGPEARARLGLIRSFQDAALFPTMTVEETVTLAQERLQRTSFIGSVLGISGRSERAKRLRSRELIGMLGLDGYKDRQIRELSTGTRRISEIACLVALEPTCLLLDEPSSGIAQRETEALGALLDDLKRQLDLTLVVIEHDIPLIMGISDRIVAMADGVVICDATPDVVRNDPRVIDAYLGGSITAIERSGAGVG